jgi:hypothetical protein
MMSVNKQLRFNIEEAAKFFYNAERTENEEYLLDIILQLGKEYNKLIEDYNKLVRENELLKRNLKLSRHCKSYK